MNYSKQQFANKHAIITGGSKGIGKAAAIEFVKHGGTVCIIARNKKDLALAAEEIQSAGPGGSRPVVSTISCDTTDMKALSPLLESHIKKNGVPDYLMNFVGFARPKYFQDLTLDDFRNIMETNYFGQLVPIMIILPHLMKERKGHIVNCSSLLGFMGIIGYTSYTPTKFAICGLTEALRNEMKRYNIRVSILFPSDTETPGFKEENMTKPLEVAIMSETGGFLTADLVARKLMEGIVRNKLYIIFGQTRLLWTIKRHFPNLSQMIMDGEVRKAFKKAAERKKINS